MSLHRNYLGDSEGHSYGKLVIGSFITTCLLVHHVSCRGFWQNTKSLRWLSPPTAHIWHPVTSGFFQNENHPWKGRDFRPSMRFREVQWGSWWWLGKLGEVPRCLLWTGLRCHCPMYNISCIFSINIYIWILTLISPQSVYVCLFFVKDIPLFLLK